MIEEKIPKDMAELEFLKFAEAMGIYTALDTSELEADDLTQFNTHKEKLLWAIRTGHLEFNENGEAVYTPHRSDYKEPITFYERTGASMIAMDSKKKGHDMAKTYAVLANMCRLPIKTITSLKGVDIGACESIFALLMG